MEYKLSVVISVYQSYEIVRRQLIHMRNMALPIEIIIVDDGSQPPIPEASYFTDNNLAWTQGLGRNLGASKAKGEYIFFTDIDHILSKEAIQSALSFTGNRMMFRRQAGILDENGKLTQDREFLKGWGYERPKLDCSVHGNTFVIRKEIFDSLGGYDLKPSTRGMHPITKKGEDCYFNKKWSRKYGEFGVTMGPDIYMFPMGRFVKDGNLNPKGLFHDLSQTKQEKFYKNG